MRLEEVLKRHAGAAVFHLGLPVKQPRVFADEGREFGHPVAGAESATIAVPNMPSDGRHDDHASAKLATDGVSSKQTQTHAIASGVSSVLISAFSVAETI